MASKPPRRVLEPLAAPQHYLPPSARELRAQAVQRLQAGLFGIAVIVLMVGLANIINTRARQAELATRPVASPSASATAQSNADPLAEAGVVPSSAPEATVSAQPGSSTPRPAANGQPH